MHIHRATPARPESIRIEHVLFTALAAAMLAAGCQAPGLTIDDTVLIGDAESPLRAVVERPGLTQPDRRIEDVEVAILVDGREIHRGETDETGHVEIHAHLPRNADVLEARAVIDGKDVRATGRVFHWARRTVVLVDIDETISHTDYHTLLSGSATDIGSTPLPHSAETLRAIARDFNIAYLTARPRELLVKTRRWIETEGFPAGPVITSDTLGDVIHQSDYKVRAIRHVRKVVPTALIGVGNTRGDSEAYGVNGMLSIEITKDAVEGFRLHGVLVRNWLEVGKFFDANREVLQDPARLRKLLKEGGMIKRSLHPWPRKK